MKLILTKTSVEVGGALADLAINLTQTNSDIAITSDATHVIYDDTNAGILNKIEINQATLIDVLAASGNVTEHIMYLKVTDTIVNTTVPVDIPKRTFRLGAIKNFGEWFPSDSEIWTENPGTGVLFSTNAFASNALSEYLTGEEMDIIRLLDDVNYSILNEEEKTALIDGGGWDVLPPSA